MVLGWGPRRKRCGRRLPRGRPGRDVDGHQCVPGLALREGEGGLQGTAHRVVEEDELIGGCGKFALQLGDEVRVALRAGDAEEAELHAPRNLEWGQSRGLPKVSAHQKLIGVARK